MAELTFKSPGVSTREIDHSGPTPQSPTGVPAGIIGPSVRGPAFVPVTVATFQDFVNKFGNADGKKFGPIAMNEWLNNAGSGTYVRVLGVGDGKKRNADGTVTNAGFVVGSDKPQENGLIGNNEYAESGSVPAVTAKAHLETAGVASAEVDIDVGNADNARSTLTLEDTEGNSSEFMFVNSESPRVVLTSGTAIQADDPIDALAGENPAAGDTAQANDAGRIAIAPIGTGGSAPTASIRLKQSDPASLDALAVDDGSSFDIDIPAAAPSSVSGTLTIKFVAEASVTLDQATDGELNTVIIVTDKDDGADGSEENALRLIKAILEGTDITTVQREDGVTNFDNASVLYASTGAVGRLGQNDYGLSATITSQVPNGAGDAVETGASIAIASVVTSTLAHRISIQTANNDAVLSMGPDAAGLQAVEAAEATTQNLVGAVITNANLLSAIKDAVNAQAGLNITAGNVDGNVLQLDQDTAGDTTTAIGQTGTFDGDDTLIVAGGTKAAPAENAANRFGGGDDGVAAADLYAGRTYVLGAFMVDANSSGLLADAGITNNAGGGAPVARGILMCPAGVIPSIKSVRNSNTTPQGVHTQDLTAANRNPTNHDSPGSYPRFGPNFMAGNEVGDLNDDLTTFDLYLNGLKITGNEYINSRTLKISFDPDQPSYFVNKLNTDPSKIEEMGHYLYMHFDISKQFATIENSDGVNANDDNSGRHAVFCLPTQQLRDTSVPSANDLIGVPNLESFEDRYSTAVSPFVISQKFGGRNRDLFRFHALDDGAVGAGAYKITIENITSSRSGANPFGKFDVLVRKFDDTDKTPFVLEAYRGVNIDPSSDRYIAKVIGDTHAYYDFDKSAASQKLVISGRYDNNSSYVRVEVSDDLLNNNIDNTALPFGFRGLNHMVFDGTAKVNANAGGNTGCSSILDHGDCDTGIKVDFQTVKMPPVPMRERLSVGTGVKKSLDSDLTWGVQFEVKPNPAEPNAGKKIDASILSHVRFMPSFDTTGLKSSVGNNAGVADIAGAILDSDRYNNNKFSLENIAVILSGDKPDKELWAYSRYIRNGVNPGTLDDDEGVAQVARLIIPSDLENNAVTKYMKFTLPLTGGFDGTDKFVKSKVEFTNEAVHNESSDPNENSVSSATIASYRKAIDVMEERADVDIQLLSVPGIRNPKVTDYAMESVERRFDALYIMDIEERDAQNNVILSDAPVSVSNTVAGFLNRDIDSSFAAAYAPDVIIKDPGTGTNVKCPPSVAVLGAISLNDTIKHPWFAPAGFNRASLPSTVEVNTRLNRSNLDDLYDAKINPITKFPAAAGTTQANPVIWGQKTLLAAPSALDRINVRRLLINVRRKVRAEANKILFEPNRESTLAQFSAAVNPILADIQANQGVDRFKVVIDTSTTTQADVENNTIRGKIFLQPTRSLEFVSLDFVVKNAGADI